MLLEDGAVKLEFVGHWNPCMRSLQSAQIKRAPLFAHAFWRHAGQENRVLLAAF